MWPAIGVAGAFVVGWIAALPAIVRAARRRRGRTVTGGILGIVDEIWHPDAASTTPIREAQVERPAPAPSPGDRELTSGRMRIDVDPAAGRTNTQRQQ